MRFKIEVLDIPLNGVTLYTPKNAYNIMESNFFSELLNELYLVNDLTVTEI